MNGEELVDLTRLRLNPRNPRRISDGAFKLLCKSIRRDPMFMELRPIVVDDEGMIIGGNQRYRACLEIGRRRVPASWVRKASELSAEQKKRFVLVDNAPEGMAGYWDWDKLQRQYDWPKLEAAGFQMPEMVDFDKAWTKMPDPTDKDGESVRRIAVHFKSRKAAEQFAKLVGQPVEPGTRHIWFPRRVD